MDESIATISSSSGDYIGTLKVRIATRLRKMIDGGNKYEILAAKLTDSEVIVVVRGTRRSTTQALHNPGTHCIVPVISSEEDR